MLLFTPVFFQIRKNFHHTRKCKFFRRYSETRPMMFRRKIYFIGKKDFSIKARVFVCSLEYFPSFRLSTQSNRIKQPTRRFRTAEFQQEHVHVSFYRDRRGTRPFNLTRPRTRGELIRLRRKKKSSGTLQRRCERMCGHESQDVGRVCDKMIHLELSAGCMCVSFSLGISVVNKGTVIMGVDLWGCDNHARVIRAISNEKNIYERRVSY